MRDAFIHALTRHAKKNKGIFLLTGDLGFSVFEEFRDSFPGRFINAGIAEANMMGVAAGLGLSGKTAVTYSIIPFSVVRCLEQIKIDVCFQKADVKIIGVGAGYAYGTLGMTHHGVEDIAVMRAYPNIRILSPSDPYETNACLELALNTKGPFYIRLGKNREPRIHKVIPKVRTGGSIVVKRGSDITFLVTGSIIQRVLDAAVLLYRKGITSTVISMYSIKPIDKKAILNAAKKTKAIFSVEEHTISGGLGSVVSEVLAEQGRRDVVFRRIGIPDTFCGKVGNQSYLLDRYGLSPKTIVRQVMEEIS